MTKPVTVAVLVLAVVSLMTICTSALPVQMHGNPWPGVFRQGRPFARYGRPDAKFESASIASLPQCLAACRGGTAAIQVCYS